MSRLEDIIHGLHVGNARNYLSTIVSNRTLHDPILFINGLSLNRLQVEALRDYFPGLVVPPHSTSIGALGAALHGLALGSQAIVDPGDLTARLRQQAMALSFGQRLELRRTEFPETNGIPPCAANRRMCAYLGIDIGSTSTKYALIDERGQMIHKCYIPTQGKPVEAVQALLEHLQSEMSPKLLILGVATTGSGRNVVGDFLGADLIIDEITAHARGAVAIDPTVDTIFEIGGQDSKYISISNTYPLELDEHSAAAGVMTRLEAYRNVIGNFLRKHQWRRAALHRPGRQKTQSAGAAPRETAMAL